MHFLHARRRVRRHVDVNVRGPARPRRRRGRSARSSAVRSAPRQLRAPPATFGDRPLVLMPSATSPRAAERFDLPREHALERVVVRDARQHARVGRQRDRRQRRAARAGTARPAPPPRAARRRRCRRCRTASSLPPPRSAATIAAAASTTGCGSAVSDALVQRDRRRRASSASALSFRARRSFIDVRAELLLGHLHRLGDLRLHLNLHRVVLAQRKALPVLRHQQPPRIGMTVEHDAEQIPDFALEPVRRRPDAADGRHVRRRRRAAATFRRRRGGGARSRPACRPARSAARAARSRPPSARRATAKRSSGRSRSVAQRRRHIVARDVDRRLQIDARRRSRR